VTKWYLVEVDDYMTLQEAAAKLGYKDASPLRHAVKRGQLQTVRKGWMHFTTQQWLDEYMSDINATKGGKGRPRGPQRSGEEPS